MVKINIKTCIIRIWSLFFKIPNDIIFHKSKNFLTGQFSDVISIRRDSLNSRLGIFDSRSLEDSRLNNLMKKIKSVNNTRYWISTAVQKTNRHFRSKEEKEERFRRKERT